MQACRLPYGLLVNGILEEMGDIKYLLSPQDLMAVELVPALMDAGVSCFKIEGRLKGPEYVALTTAAYRRAVDVVWAAMQQPPVATPPVVGPRAGAAVAAMEGTAEELLPREAEVALRQVFARGQDEVHTGAPFTSQLRPSRFVALRCWCRTQGRAVPSGTHVTAGPRAETPSALFSGFFETGAHAASRCTAASPATPAPLSANPSPGPYGTESLSPCQLSLRRKA